MKHRKQLMDTQISDNPKLLPPESFCTFRVAAYNLHAETHGWGPNRFEAHDPTQELERLNADVYILPETWFPYDSAEPQSNVVEWAAKTGRTVHTARSSKATPRHATGCKGDAHVAIVTNLPVHATWDHKLPRHPKDGSTDRNVIAVLLQINELQKVWVLAVHMSANVPHAPIHNLKNLNEFLNDLEATGHPVIIGGDFNLWGWWVRSIHRRNYRRAVRGRTWPAYRPHSQIDHILVPDKFRITKSAVLPTSFSDHRGIYADLTTRFPLQQLAHSPEGQRTPTTKQPKSSM